MGGGSHEQTNRFAVLDLETTGLFTGYHHRVIEIALVCIDSRGAVEDEYSTLINPERDLGPSDIHGIFGSDLTSAPFFSEVAGDILDRLEGRILTCHNFRFDHDFLSAELRRCDYAMPPIEGLCTMTMARRLHSGKSHRLRDCCEAQGLSHLNEHDALSDARATVHLLLRYLELAKAHNHSLREFGCSGLPAFFPSRHRLGRGRTPVRRGERTAPPNYIATLMPRLPAPNLPDLDGSLAAYAEALDRVLEDRIVSHTEAAELIELANEWGLDRGDVDNLHRAYLAALWGAAGEDGIITDRERRDIERVQELLGLDEFDEPKGVSAPPPVADSQHEMVGKTVCFTGKLLCRYEGNPITRETAEELAGRAGLVPRPSVTKTLDVLVVADPDTLSGKAKKAREYGTRIMAETAFWDCLGIKVV